jgi:hypothetical protein
LSSFIHESVTKAASCDRKLPATHSLVAVDNH